MCTGVGKMVRKQRRAVSGTLTGILMNCLPKPVDEVLTGATVRLGGYRDVTGDEMKVKVWMKIEIFEQI